MSGVNKVIILGRLARDPEVRYAANGSAIANLSVATSEQWKDKNTGEDKEKAEFHRVVIFGKLAEIAAQYLTKGSQVYLEGKLQTRKWQDQTGQDRYSTEVVLDFNGVMQMLGGGGQQQQPQQQYQQYQQYQQPQGAPRQAPAQGGYAQPQQAPAYQPNDFDLDDSVPF